MNAARPSRGDLLVTLGNEPEPAGVRATAAANPIGDRLLTHWRTHMPAHEDNGRGDVEDFWEMAARLTAALEAGAPRVWLHVWGDEAARLLVHGQPIDVHVPLDGFEAAIREGTVTFYGPLTTISPMWRVIDNRADSYHRTRTFADHAGRATAVAGYLPEEPPHSPHAQVHDVLTKMAADGHREVLVKDVRAKHGLWRVPTSLDADTNRKHLLDRLGWGLINVEGSPNTLSVQQIVEMTYEYRVFIVDGEPITGAGCIEEQTPLAAPSEGGFSASMCRHRPLSTTDEFEADWMSDRDADGAVVEARHKAETGPVEARPVLAQMYTAFARKVAQAALAEESMPRAYVIDCALGPDGRPLVVEMNGLSNAGLYASQPWLVTRALHHCP